MSTPGSRCPLLPLVLFLAVAAGALSAWANATFFRFAPFDSDTASYLFQAKLFSQGRAYAPAPPELGFINSEHNNITNGKWYSKYPPGNALLLSIGVLFGVPWLIPALLTAITLLLIFLLVREAYSERTAILAAILGFLSPSLVGIGATLLSENTSRCFLALFLFSLFKTLKTRSVLFAATAGASLGFAFCTRPLAAVIFGCAGAAFSIFWISKEVKAGPSYIKPLAAFLLPLALFISVLLSWNAFFTGSPLKNTFNAMQPYDRMGFGIRSEGYAAYEDIGTFTPSEGLRRTWRCVLPCIGLNTLGWGYYTPSAVKGWILPHFFVAFPLLLTYALIFLPLFSGGKNRYDFLFLSIFLAALLGYYFHFWDGSLINSTPLNAAYYNETILLAMVPLISRGILLLDGKARSRLNSWRIPLYAVICVLLGFNMYLTARRDIGEYRAVHPVYQELPLLVEKQGVHHAVIFIPALGSKPENHSTPLGEYPFKPLQEADVVYFQNKDYPQWLLVKQDWREVYARYFAGRKAYEYDGTLKELFP